MLGRLKYELQVLQGTMLATIFGGLIYYRGLELYIRPFCRYVYVTSIFGYLSGIKFINITILSYLSYKKMVTF